MNGLRTQRLIWTIVFLGITLVAIVLECVAGLWHPAGWTIPWTEYIARYVPWPIQLLAYVALAVWLPFHFWRHDHMRGVAYRDGVTMGRHDVVEQVREIIHANGGVMDVPTLQKALAAIAVDEKIRATVPVRPVPRGVCPACRQDLM